MKLQILDHAILNTCKREEEAGRCAVSYLHADSKGLISPDELERIFDGPRAFVASCETTLVSVMFANNEIGTIEPIKALCEVAHKHGALFHTDAVQAAGHVKIDVNELEVDFLSASAHKFNGPKGIGFLYCRGGRLTPLHSGGAQENGLRAGTEDVASIVGMATALKRNCSDIEKHTLHIKELEELLIIKLKKSGLDFLRNGTNQLPGNVSLSFKNADGEMLLHRLDLKKICISTGSACDSVNTQVSHVISAIRIKETYAKGTIRISLGRENTSAEISIMADSLVEILKD